MTIRKFLLLAIVIGGMFTLSACGGLDQSIWAPDPIEAPPPPTPREEAATTDFGWAPGTYTGVGEGGHGGNIYVEVVIDNNGQIASITITDHSETQGFLDMVKMQVIGDIISTQSTDVDTFTGATLSSEAVIRAVEDALPLAAVDSGAQQETPQETSEAADSTWAPGTYTGVGEGGHGGNIYVEVVIDNNGQIASITITDHSETQGFLDMVETMVIGSIISTQSTDVDVFVGATLSSEAVIRAVEDALDGIQ